MVLSAELLLGVRSASRNPDGGLGSPALLDLVGVAREVPDSSYLLCSLPVK